MTNNKKEIILDKRHKRGGERGAEVGKPLREEILNFPKGKREKKIEEKFSRNNINIQYFHLFKSAIFPQI